MLRALCLSTMALLFLAGHASADAAPDLGANAALKYWQAFATMPTFTEAEQNDFGEHYLTMPLDAKARSLVDRAEYSLRMMHRAAAVRPCNWGIGWRQDGAELRLPQMMAARTLTTLACLRARMEADAGRTSDAVDDLLAALTMGRQVSLDGSLIGVLVGYNIEIRVYDALGQILPGLRANALKALPARLAALPPGGRPATAMRAAEENSVNWIGDKVRACKDKQALLTMLSGIMYVEGKPGEAEAKARALVEECGGDAAGVLKKLEELRPMYARTAPKLDLPLEQSVKEMEQEAQIQPANPMYKLLFPSLLKCRQAQAQSDVRRALLLAAIDIAGNGPNALKNHPDPITHGLFEMVPFDGGFELRSPWKHDRPVTLTVGQKK